MANGTTIRFPSPLTVGLAAGLPAAADAFVRGLELGQRRRERQEDFALRRQQVASQEATAEQLRQAREFELQQARARASAQIEFPEALTAVRGLLAGTPGVSILPTANRAEFELPELRGANPPLPPEQVLTTPEGQRFVSVGLQAGVLGREALAPGISEVFKDPDLVRRERETRDRADQGRKLVDESFQTLSDIQHLDEDSLAAALLGVERGRALQGQPVNLGQSIKLLGDRQEKARINRDFQGPLGAVSSKIFRGEVVTPEEAYSIINLMHAAESDFVRQKAAEYATILIGSAIGPEKQALAEFNRLRGSGRSLLDAVQEIQQRFPSVATVLNQLPEVKLFRDVQEERLKTRAREEEKRAAVPPEERDLARRFQTARTEALEALSVARKTARTTDQSLILSRLTASLQRMEALKESITADETLTQEEKRLTFADINALTRDLLAEASAARRKLRETQGTPPAGETPGKGQRFQQLPDPATLRGAVVEDEQTGQRYRSDGTRWVPIP